RQWQFHGSQSAGSGALRRDLEHIERLARGPEEGIALWAAKTQIGAHFRKPNAADQLACGVEHEYPGVAERRTGAAPQITGNVGAHPVWPAFDAVDRHVR